MKATPAVSRARKAWYRRHRAAVLLTQKARDAGVRLPIAEARRILDAGNRQSQPGRVL